MRVTHVSLSPTSAAQEAGRPALTPELLAATGARYSRSNEGLEAILAKIDPQNPEKSIDGIFRMVDYGHASIADMAPVAMFLDGVSMWLAYHLWSLCPTAGGQESSTRYIRLDASNLPDAAEIGIPENRRDEWKKNMDAAFEAYEKAIAFWENDAAQTPEKTRIPKSLLEDSSEKAQKQVARMKRNYAFDRARYFLPTALKTNVMLVQSARAWVTLCQQLLSHPLPEVKRLGSLVRDELELVAPRLIKHAEAKETWEKAIVAEWERLYQTSRECWSTIKKHRNEAQTDSGPRLEVFADAAKERFFVDDLQFHSNRYAHMGIELQRTPVRFSWGKIAFGDMRDLNRHRTGTKMSWFMPWGFYGATDQSASQEIHNLGKIGAQLNFRGYDLLLEPDPTYIYWTLLGSQFLFEHTTTADKFIYEAELRTGVGAHYRYAQHLRDVLALWYEKFPATRGLILEGSAEPE